MKYSLVLCVNLCRKNNCQIIAGSIFIKQMQIFRTFSVQLNIVNFSIVCLKCTCTDDGRYYNEYCQVLSPCVQNECSNNAICVPSNDWDMAYTYTCNCTLGWEGELCEIDIDECETVNCLNGGNCTDLVGTFSCLCSAGYEGM